MTTPSDIELYIEGHYAAWRYEQEHGIKFTPMELRNFVKEFIENEGGVSPV